MALGRGRGTERSGFARRAMVLGQPEVGFDPLAGRKVAVGWTELEGIEPGSSHAATQRRDQEASRVPYWSRLEVADRRCRRSACSGRYWICRLRTSLQLRGYRGPGEAISEPVCGHDCHLYFCPNIPPDHLAPSLALDNPNAVPDPTPPSG